MKKQLSILLVIAMLTALLCGCTSETVEEHDGNRVALSDTGISFNGNEVSEESEGVFISHDVIYYEDRDSYDDGFTYGEGTDAERHSAEDAEACTVLNITEAGTYTVSGKLSDGQIRVDLGENASSDPEAVVTLILDGLDISCDLAPAVLFMNVYECADEAEKGSYDVDTSAAGANVIIADGSENNVNGSHVAKIFKDSDEEKKLWKQDAAFYSYMSMNVDGSDGVLNINGDNEGLDTEMHLTINGGVINITSQDDGINTNEDGVSVTTINGGTVRIVGGLGAEGDGIDSNGWLVINGGNVIASANPASDSGLDSDMGSYINGGNVIAFGSTMDWAESDSEQVTVNLQFAEYKNAADEIDIIKETDGDTETDGGSVFSFDPTEDALLSEYSRQYKGVIISCPAFEIGESYNVYVGGIQQAYTGTDVMGGAMAEPPNAEQSKMMPKPDDSGEAPPEPPQGSMQGEPPEKPQDESEPMPQGMEPMNRPADAGEASVRFLMQDKVNCFSGIRNAE